MMAAWGSSAWAQTIESVLRPGDVIQGTPSGKRIAKSCHVKFDRAAQDRLLHGLP